MAKRKSPPKQHLPVRHSSHIKEDESRLIFEKAIKPWMVCAWLQKDYGIDAFVEITRNISQSACQIVTGKRFSVQLKSTEQVIFNDGIVTISIDKAKISYWYNSLEPVLIVLVDLTTEQCYYTWIDDALISSLTASSSNWISQETVTIKFSANRFLDKMSIPVIEKHVIHWKRPSKTIITPGSYFQFNSDLRETLLSIDLLCKKYKLEDLNSNIKSIENTIGKTIYTLAVVGPSRAGKSTLINCLLRQEISPVGILPTTGIPITIYPRGSNKCEVILSNGEKIAGDVDQKFLELYTSQEFNPDNIKKVSLVSVSVVNLLLEKGLALCDVPGLDDPDENIRNITKTAVSSAGAIVYVINAGPMKEGGFSITKQMIEELHELGRQMDRVFIVLNKMDQLDEERTARIKTYIDTTLDKYGIIEYLPIQPLYISASESLESRLSQARTYDTVSDLEEKIWSFLLEKNKTGMNKLIGDYASVQNLTGNLHSLVKSRLIDAAERNRIESDITEVTNDIYKISNRIPDEIERIKKQLKVEVDDAFSNILRYLENDLRSVMPPAELPDKSLIAPWLQDYANKIVNGAYQEAEKYVADLANRVNIWISEQLNQVEVSIDRAYKNSQRQLPNIEFYSHHIGAHFEDDRTRHPGLLESALIFMGYAIGSIITFIEEAFLTAEQKKEGRIRQLMRKAKKGCEKVSVDLLTSLDQYLDAVSWTLTENSMERSEIYLDGLKKQLAKLSTPLLPQEKIQFEQCLDELETIKLSVERGINNLKEYADGIKIEQG